MTRPSATTTRVLQALVQELWRLADRTSHRFTTSADDQTVDEGDGTRTTIIKPPLVEFARDPSRRRRPEQRPTA